MNATTAMKGIYPCSETRLHFPAHVLAMDLWPEFREQDTPFMAMKIIFPLNDDDEEIENGAGEPIYKLAITHPGHTGPKGGKTGRIRTLYLPQNPLQNEPHQNHHPRPGRIRVPGQVCLDMTARPA